MTTKTDPASKAQQDSHNTSMDAINAQKAMNAESLRLNVAMGWLQMAMAMTGKISGR